MQKRPRLYWKGRPSALSVLLLGTILTQPAIVWAQDAGANSGAVIEQLERQRERLEEREKSREDIAPPEKIATPSDKGDAADQATFLLRSVRFTESDQLSRDDLTGIVSPWLEKSVTLRDLFKIVEEINALYRSKEIYTSVALLPQQTIKDGVVVIQLVEGELGELVVEGSEWTGEDWVKGWVNQEGESRLDDLDVKFLESNILLFNRLNDQQLQAQLRAGEVFGKTDIVVNVQEPRRNSYQLWFDNYGYKSSGDETIGALFQRQKVMTDSDRGLLYATVTDGSQSFIGDYSTGLGHSRWRLGASANLTKTEVISGPFAEADVESRSKQAGLHTSYLAWSSTSAWVDVRGLVNRTWSKSTTLDHALSETRIDRFNLTPTLTVVGANWRLNASAAYTMARLDDQLDPDANRNVDLWYLSANSVWRPWSAVYFLGRYEQQGTADDSVPGSLAFNLGGATTIRGYEPGLISGDSGRFYQAEVHYDEVRRWGKVFDFSLFFDEGRYKSAFQSDRLNAAGFGLAIYGGLGPSFDLSVAKRMTNKLYEHDDWQVYGRLSWNL